MALSHVDNNSLLRKLKHYEISWIQLNLLKSYIFNSMRQKVIINDVYGDDWWVMHWTQISLLKCLFNNPRFYSTVYMYDENNVLSNNKSAYI